MCDWAKRPYACSRRKNLVVDRPRLCHFVVAGVAEPPSVEATEKPKNQPFRRWLTMALPVSPSHPDVLPISVSLHGVPLRCCWARLLNRLPPSPHHASLPLHGCRSAPEQCGEMGQQADNRTTEQLTAIIDRIKNIEMGPLTVGACRLLGEPRTAGFTHPQKPVRRILVQSFFFNSRGLLCVRRFGQSNEWRT